MSKKVNRPIYVPLEKAKEIGAYIKEPDGTITPVLVGSLDDKPIPLEGGVQIPIENFPVITINEPKKLQSNKSQLPKRSVTLKPKKVNTSKSKYVKLQNLHTKKYEEATHQNPYLIAYTTDSNGNIEELGDNRELSDSLPINLLVSPFSGQLMKRGLYGDLYAPIDREYHDPADNAANWALFGALVAPQFTAEMLAYDALPSMTPGIANYLKRNAPRIASVLGLGALGTASANAKNKPLTEFKYDASKVPSKVAKNEDEWNQLMHDSYYNHSDSLPSDYNLKVDTTKFSEFDNGELGKIAETLDPSKVYDSKTLTLKDKEDGFNYYKLLDLPYELIGVPFYAAKKNPEWLKNILSKIKSSKFAKRAGLLSYIGLNLARIAHGFDLWPFNNTDSGREEEIINAIEKMLEERRVLKEQRKRATEVIKRINDANMGVSSRHDSIVSDSSGILNTLQLTDLYQDSAGTSQLGMRPEQ